MWKDAWWLAKQQWLNSKLGFLFTIVFFGVYGAFSGFFASVWLEESAFVQGIFVDMLVLTFLSSSGFIFSKAYLINPYWKNDSFTTKLAMLRTLPIPIETLAVGRLVQVLLMSPVSTIAFLVPMYATSVWAKSIPIPAYIGFMIVWLVYGNLISMLMIIMEWSTNGRRYLWGSIFAVVAIVGAAIVYYVVMRQHIVYTLGEAVKSPLGWLWPVVAIAVGIAGHAALQSWMRKTIKRREFA